MGKYTNSAGKKVRIDLGNNLFIEDKCVNPKAGELPSDWQKFNATIVENGSQDGQLIPREEKVLAIGHVPNFTYGQDTNGKPIQVNTGHKAW